MVSLLRAGAPRSLRLRPPGGEPAAPSTWRAGKPSTRSRPRCSTLGVRLASASLSEDVANVSAGAPKAAGEPRRCRQRAAWRAANVAELHQWPRSQVLLVRSRPAPTPPASRAARPLGSSRALRRGRPRLGRTERRRSEIVGGRPIYLTRARARDTIRRGTLDRETAPRRDNWIRLIKRGGGKKAL